MVQLFGLCGRDGRTSETVIVEIKNENVSIVLNTITEIHIVVYGLMAMK